jgi:tRNA(Met) C34 N-acetyltransferase TmcA
MKAVLLKSVRMNGKSLSPASIVEFSDEEFARLSGSNIVRAATKSDLLLAGVDEAPAEKAPAKKPAPEKAEAAPAKPATGSPDDL